MAVIFAAMNIRLDHRLSVALPSEIRAAVDRVAAARGISAPDYARRALGAALTVEGEHFRRLPDLQRGTDRKVRA